MARAAYPIPRLQLSQWTCRRCPATATERSPGCVLGGSEPVGWLPVFELVRNRGARTPEPPFGTPLTMIVRLVAGIQNRLFWRVGSGRAR